MTTPELTQSVSFTTTQQRAIQLLGDGHTQVTVARALGLSESRISQLMEDKSFAQEVANRRFDKLEKYNDIDSKYDKLESMALDKLEKALPIVSITSPEKLVRIIATLNGAKRRGQETPSEQVMQHHTVVNLTLPVQVMTKFTTSQQTNEVIEIDGVALITASPDSVVKRHESRTKEIAALGLPRGEAKSVAIPTIREGQTISASDLE